MRKEFSTKSAWNENITFFRPLKLPISIINEKESIAFELIFLCYPFLRFNLFFSANFVVRWPSTYLYPKFTCIICYVFLSTCIPFQFSSLFVFYLIFYFSPILDAPEFEYEMKITWLHGSGSVLTSAIEYVKEPSPDRRLSTAKSVLKLKASKALHNKTIHCQAQNSADKTFHSASIRLEVSTSHNLMFHIVGISTVFTYDGEINRERVFACKTCDALERSTQSHSWYGWN